VNDAATALFGIADRPRANAAQAIERLHKLGVKTLMLTSDAEAAAHYTQNRHKLPPLPLGEGWGEGRYEKFSLWRSQVYIAARVGIGQVVAQARPERKLEVIRELQAKGEKVGMIGDGVNDAPALAAADVGFAMGAGADVAIETADMTLVHGDIAKAAEAMALSADTLRIIKQNLFWAFGYIDAGANKATSSSLSLRERAGVRGLHVALSPQASITSSPSPSPPWAGSAR
jgi:Cu+-exporting ATPase